jgi:cytochrome c oxidase subunit I+III
MVSTIGAYIIAAGVLIFLIDLARNFRPTGGQNAGNIWNAGTLEWLPNDNYGVRSIPIVMTQEPLWEQQDLAEDVQAGRYYLPNAPTGGRETIVTSPIDARPQYVLQMPGPSWPPVLAAFGTAGFFLLLTVKLTVPAFLSGILAVVMVFKWMWDTDPAPVPESVDIGGGIRLPTTMTGPSSHSWWAMVVLILVSGSIFGSMLFSYLFLWTVSPDVWPQSGSLPSVVWPLASSGLLVASAGGIAWLSNSLKRGNAKTKMLIVMPAAVVLLLASVVVDMFSQMQTGLRPQDSAYGAAVFTISGLQAFFTVIVAMMGMYTLVRSRKGLLDERRRATFDNTMLFWYYTVMQGLIGMGLTHFFPRLTG